jgi:hypothetical protein
MKLWIDDVRPAPEGYVWARSVNQAVHAICVAEYPYFNHRDVADVDIISIIDCDHDAGDYAKDGGDYIRLLDWLEETGRNYPIRIHSANPVGVQNMRRIIERNGWKEIR